MVGLSLSVVVVHPVILFPCCSSGRVQRATKTGSFSRRMEDVDDEMEAREVEESVLPGADEVASADEDSGEKMTSTFLCLQFPRPRLYGEVS